MGWFDDFKANLGGEIVSNNGLSNGSRFRCCEECRYRVIDNRRTLNTGHYHCYIRGIKVGANQVCGNFSKGDAEYQLR